MYKCVVQNKQDTKIAHSPKLGAVCELGAREVGTVDITELGLGNSRVAGDLRDDGQLDHFNFGVHGAEVLQRNTLRIGGWFG